MSGNGKSLVPVEYGDKDEIVALGKRLKAMVPGDLNDAEALALAQYSRLVDANPFRGEIYAYTDWRGKMNLVEGYKLLVRWARRQCNFSERYEPLEDLPEGAIGYQCHILRDDAKDTLAELVKVGADFQTAFEIAASSAVGVVTKDEMWSTRKNKAIAPPAGWTWEQVAKKRALKNTLNIAYGAPSPKEIARETWMVGGTETAPEDWQVIDPTLSPGEREQLAALAAETRQRNEERGGMTPEKAREILERNRVILHGDPDDDGDLIPPNPGPYFEAEDVEVLNKAGESVKLGDLDNEALGYIVNHPDTFSRDERESASVILAARNGNGALEV